MTGSSTAPTPPSGTVAFLFTDVEGSTRLWAADGEAMAASLRLHDELLRGAIESNGGYVFTTAGDSFAAAFSRASDAVAAAIAAQEVLGEATWPGPDIKVRMGLHLGEADERDGDYFGSCVNTAARIEAAAHGGQIVISGAVRSVADCASLDLGEHHLRDVAEPVHLFQVGDGEFPPLRVSDPSSSNLPVRPTRLLGREPDIRSTRATLLERRLVTVAAVGGCGKTRLAIAVGEEELPHRPDGVWFVDLTAVLSPEDVAPAVADAVGLSLSTGDATEQVVRFFADKDALVILDNCEHVIEGAAEFAERFLETAGATSILATSRESLDIDGEAVVSLSSLVCDGPESPGVRLFLDRAVSAFPAFDVSEPNLEVVSELCSRLDGVPLAIELAAARATVMTATELLEGLSDRFKLLSGGRRRQRQRTLEATLDWSYNLLEPDEQRAFRSLGVFVDGFDIDAMAAVVGVDRARAVELLEALVAKSLVVRTDRDGSARFVLLETLKAYAEDRLVAGEESAAVRDRHLEHFVEVSRARETPVMADVRVGIPLRHDASNLISAIDWAMDREQHELAVRLMLAADPVLTLFGRAPEMLALLRRTHPLVAAVDPSLGHMVAAIQISSLIVLDDFPDLLRLTTELSHAATRTPQILSVIWLGWMSMLLAPEQGWSLLDQAERLIEEQRASMTEGDVWCCTATLLYAQSVGLGYGGDFPAALAKADEVLNCERSNDHLTFVGTLIGGAALAATCRIILGRPEEALELLDENRRLGHDQLQFSDGSELRPLALLGMGELELATEEIRRSAIRALQGRFKREENDIVFALAQLARTEGRDDIAVELLSHMGLGRQPATIMAASEMARRLNIADQHEASIREEALSVRATGDTQSKSMRALRAELERRGWLNESRAVPA